MSGADLGRHPRHRAEVTALVAVLVIAAGIAAGWLVLMIRGGSAAQPAARLLLQRVDATGCNAASTNPALSELCGLETVSLSGGSPRPMPPPPANAMGAGVVGHRVAVVATGRSGSGPVSGLYVGDLLNGSWRHLKLSSQFPVAVDGASGLEIGAPDGALDATLSPDESEVAFAFAVSPQAAGVAVVNLSTGAIRLLDPVFPGQIALKAWLADGIHVSAPCPGASSNGAACGYVVATTGGRARPSPTPAGAMPGAHRRPVEDGLDVEVVGSPDGTQEAVARTGIDSSGNLALDVLSGPTGGSLRGVYALPLTLGQGSLTLTVNEAVGDDDSVLIEASGPDGFRDVLAAPGAAAVALTSPTGLWSPPTEGSGILALALPGGGFVEPEANVGAPVETVVEVRPGGAARTIASVPEASAYLVGVVW